VSRLRRFLHGLVWSQRQDSRVGVTIDPDQVYLATDDGLLRLNSGGFLTLRIA
jgi:hypothetical protein